MAKMKTEKETAAHRKAVLKYTAKAYDKIELRIRKNDLTTRDIIKQRAARLGKSTNEYILDLIKEDITNNNTKPETVKEGK